MTSGGCTVHDVGEAGYSAPVANTSVATGTTIVVTCSGAGYLPNSRHSYSYPCESLDSSVYCSREFKNRIISILIVI